MNFIIIILTTSIFHSSAVIGENYSNYDNQLRPGLCTKRGRNLERYNEKIIVKFYESHKTPESFETFATEFISENFIQHNPWLKDGRDAVIAGVTNFFVNQTTVPNTSIEHISGNGDLVWAHVKDLTPQGMLLATFALFRLKCGLIVEHWDTIQFIDPNANYVSDHPFF